MGRMGSLTAVVPERRNLRPQILVDQFTAQRAFADLSAYDAVVIGLTDEEAALLAGISHFPPGRLRKRE